MENVKDYREWDIDGRFINGVFFFIYDNWVCACDYPETINGNMSKANHIQNCSYLDMGNFDIAGKAFMCDLFNCDEQVYLEDEIINGANYKIHEFDECYFRGFLTEET